MDIGQVIRINTWRAPKAKQAVVVRTYKAPDDDTVLALPATHPLFDEVVKATAAKDSEVLKPYLAEIWANSKTFYKGEWN